MIVERRIHKVKPFCERPTVDFMKEAQKAPGYPHAVQRIYMPISGPENVIYHEYEFKDWQEREKFWADFRALPQMPEWIEKWKALIEPGGSIEFLNLME